MLYSVWNVRYDYKSLSVRGGGQSMYWCNVCLPERYRTVADSMLRGKETTRILQGKTLETAALRPIHKEPAGADRIPWRSML